MDKIRPKEYRRLWRLLFILEIKGMVYTNNKSLVDINILFLTRKMKNRLL